MDERLCPFCKEPIKEDAIKCKHCFSMVYSTSAQMAVAALMRIGVETHIYQVPQPSGDPCEAMCYHRVGGHKGALEQCLDDCKAIAAARYTVERLQREIVVTAADIIWGGGDIDPLPLERAIRERFSQPPDQ